jgi:nucleotide-binding universal stress UspA family protein
VALTTILVGCDLSPGSDQALERAVGIAAPHGATVVLVHAQTEDAPPAEIDHAMQEQLGEVSALVRARDARELADRMTQIQAQGVAVDLISRNGPPEEVLAQAAADRQAELIAIGSHGHTGIARMLLGSVASSTIRHATCDVLVCRGPTAGTRFQRPLVATDFSPVAAKVLEHAARVAEPGAPFDLVHAWQLPTGSWGATLLGQARFPWSTVRDAVLASARSLADKLVAEHQDLGHPLNVDLVQGPPASVITHAAERAGNDLIVVGAHGRRGVRRLLLGSVAESTIRHSPCSVLVVHGDPKP